MAVAFSFTGNHWLIVDVILTGTGPSAKPSANRSKTKNPAPETVPNKNVISEKEIAAIVTIPRVPFLPIKKPAGI